MKVTTLQVSSSSTLNRFYRDFSTPAPAKYRVDLQREAPVLQQKIDSLKEEERRQYVVAFAATWNGLDPATRQAIVGGAAGGAAGAGLALTTLSIQEIGKLIGGPVGFVIGVTVLGVVGGALTPAALNQFTENKAKVSVQTPTLWNVVLPQVKLELEGSGGKKPAAGGGKTA
jgi:hypothetical protein